MLWQKKRWMSRTAAMALTWILTGFCGVMWGSVYLIFSLSQASMPPFLYTGTCLLGFFSLRTINKYRLVNLDSTVFIFGQIQLILMLILPISMHVVLGGLARSNASCVMSWCIIAPAGAIFYCNIPADSSYRSMARTTQTPLWVRVFPSVFTDMYVAIAVIAYVAASATIIACEQFLPAVPPPPLLLRQASLLHSLRCFANCAALKPPPQPIRALRVLFPASLRHCRLLQQGAVPRGLRFDTVDYTD